MAQDDLASQITAIAIGYLGPAARVFLERQTKSHMDGLMFSAVQRKDLPVLQNWVLISASLLIDRPKAKEFAEKISKL